MLSFFFVRELTYANSSQQMLSFKTVFMRLRQRTFLDVVVIPSMHSARTFQTTFFHHT